jgi:phage terminase small subunit
MSKKKFTAKQRAFVAEYLVDLNATRAAIRAGFSPKTAEWIGPQLLGKAHVATAIAEGMARRSARTEITADRVLRELGRLAFLDIRKAFTEDGNLRSLSELDDDTAAAIAGIEVSELRDSDGAVIGHVKKVRLADKIAALTLLARHLGLLQDRLKVSGDTENPLVALLKVVQGNSIPLVPIVHHRND